MRGVLLSFAAVLLILPGGYRQVSRERASISSTQTLSVRSRGRDSTRTVVRRGSDRGLGP